MRTAINRGLFRIDGLADRELASGPIPSRYGSYLQQASRTFEEITEDGYDDPSVPFAAACWRIATAPIMVPSFVMYPRRVLSATVGRSDWNGEAIIDVEIVSELPESVATAKTSDGRYYHDWPTSYSGEYEGIGGDDLASRPYLLPRAQLLVQLAPGTLPRIGQVPAPGLPRLREAVACLEVLVQALNDEVGPLLSRLDGR